MPHFFTDYFNLNTPEDLQTQTHSRTWTRSSLSAHGYVKVKSKVLLLKGNFHYKGVSICKAVFIPRRSCLKITHCLKESSWQDVLMLNHNTFLLLLSPTCLLSQKAELRLFSTQTILMVCNNHLWASLFPSLSSFLSFFLFKFILCRPCLKLTVQKSINLNFWSAYLHLPVLGLHGTCIAGDWTQRFVLVGKVLYPQFPGSSVIPGEEEGHRMVRCVTRLEGSEGVGLGIQCSFHWILTASSAGHRIIPL